MSWDPATGKTYFNVNPGDSFITETVFSPDGSKIALSGDTLTPTVVDASTGETLFRMSGAGVAAYFIAYSPDGTRIATAHIDGTARLWDGSTGHELLTLYGSPMIMQSVAFSPDGTRLALASDEDIRVYLLRIDDLVALAKTRVTRSRTQEECSKFLHVDTCPPPE